MAPVSVKKSVLLTKGFIRKRKRFVSLSNETNKASMRNLEPKISNALFAPNPSSIVVSACDGEEDKCLLSQECEDSFCGIEFLGHGIFFGKGES